MELTDRMWVTIWGEGDSLVTDGRMSSAVSPMGRREEGMSEAAIWKISTSPKGRIIECGERTLCSFVP